MAGVPAVAPALASGRVKVARPAKLSSATIAEAVEAAREKAGPVAAANAREEAQRLAAASGLTLGELRSVAVLAPSPFWPSGSYGLDGTFGPGKFCGTIHTPVFRRGKDGRRVFQPRFRKRFGCRVPPQATVTLSATFAASRAMPYLDCRACSLRLYTAATHLLTDECPRCGAPVRAQRDRGSLSEPSGSASSPPPEQGWQPELT